MDKFLRDLIDQLTPKQRQAFNKDKRRAITFNLNERCPLKCRHCSVGFSSEYKGNGYRVTPQEMESIISAVDINIYNKVYFAGGEPTLEPDLIRTGVKACKGKGLLSGVVTAPVWARTPAAADRFLESVDGLNEILLSLDTYHLEFLKISHYQNAIRAASARGIEVLCNICCIEDSEKRQLVEELGETGNIIKYISKQVLLPIGNAAKESNNIAFRTIPVGKIEDLSRIERTCVVGTVYLDKEQSAYGCCFACIPQKSPLKVERSPIGLSTSLLELENSPVFQAVLNQGFIDSLTAEGKQELVKLANGRAFVNECHLCIAAMEEGDDSFWSHCKSDNGATVQ